MQLCRNLLLSLCVVLWWSAMPCDSKGITCEDLWGRFAKHDCDMEALTERCLRIERRLGIKDCLGDGAPTTTEAPTATEAPVTPATPQYCISLVPGRSCTSSESCDAVEDSRPLPLVCGDSPAGYVCCQEPTDAPGCPEGTDAATNQVTKCMDRSDCLSKSGSTDNQYWCGYGPEMCCTYAA